MYFYSQGKAPPKIQIQVMAIASAIKFISDIIHTYSLMIQ